MAKSLGNRKMGVLESGWGQFVGSGSLAVSVPSGPPLSAVPVIKAMDWTASERALLTGPP